MDINNLTHHPNGKLNRTDTTQKEASVGNSGSAPQTDQDTISLKGFNFRNDDHQFAKLELNKLNKTANEQFSDYKAKMIEYKKAAQQSSEAAKQTEIGRMINNPDIWKDIATMILN